MTQLNRRQLLRAGLTAVTVAQFGASRRSTALSSLSSVFFPAAQAANSDRDAHLDAYDPETSKLLVRCCDLAGEQYHRSKADAAYDGAIRSLDAYRRDAALLAPYRQIESLQISGLLAALPTPSRFWGYALSSEQDNIIALRGTQTEAEMAMGATTFQVSFGSAGRVHAGFSLIYQGLIDQIRAAAAQFDPDLPCYFTGYSLGGAVAILAAATLANETRLNNQLRVYTYAGPRVGDPAFAEAYNPLLPHSYRVVNRADLVPDLPPETFRGEEYRHVGQELAYSLQCKNFDRNHAISTYRQAVDQGLELADGTQQMTCT